MKNNKINALTTTNKTWCTLESHVFVQLSNALPGNVIFLIKKCRAPFGASFSACSRQNRDCLLFFWNQNTSKWLYAKFLAFIRKTHITLFFSRIEANNTIFSSKTPFGASWGLIFFTNVKNNEIGALKTTNKTWCTLESHVFVQLYNPLPGNVNI